MMTYRELKKGYRKGELKDEESYGRTINYDSDDRQVKDRNHGIMVIRSEEKEVYIENDEGDKD